MEKLNLDINALNDLQITGIEVINVEDAMAMPETGASSGISSCGSSSCCGSTSCCSSSGGGGGDTSNSGTITPGKITKP